MASEERVIDLRDREDRLTPGDIRVRYLVTAKQAEGLIYELNPMPTVLRVKPTLMTTLPSAAKLEVVG